MFDCAYKPLPTGYVLDVYRFEQVLGSPGAFGITYAARERGVDRRVAIKELFPSDFVVRRGSDRVEVQAGSLNDMFLEAKRMFQQEAEILSQVKHENVVKVLDYFEANGTGYMVMAYEDGYDLGDHLVSQRPARLNENELRNLLMPLLDGLQAVHELNYLHRDIKPSNIYLTRDHKPLLLDFGAARQIVVSRTRAIEQILTPPYAPFEQYAQSLPQGPYTDLYAMGVVSFVALFADERFPHAPDRLDKDPFVPLQKRLRGQEYSQKFLEALDWALQFRAQERPQSVVAWRNALAPHPKKVVRRESIQPRKSKDDAKPRVMAITFGIVIAIAALVAVVAYFLNW
jgi:serine/threonine protein kinase